MVYEPNLQFCINTKSLQQITGDATYLIRFYIPSLNIPFEYECIFVNMMIDAQLYFHNKECEVIEAVY